MAVLTWDQTSKRFYQTGVDRGVLFLQDGRVVAWNGLTGIEDDSSSELKTFYLDGVKYLETLIPGDFTGKLKAFTYPDEFDSVCGIAPVAPGLAYYNQPAKSFNLSYRTKIGNDVEGMEFGYKIHLLYNVLANPDSVTFETLKDSGAQPIEFAWTLTGTPPKIQNFRPTVHISIDSTEIPADLLEILENMLYGTDVSSPRLPSIQEIAALFGYLGALIIVDNHDGTWTAIDESNTYITMLNQTTFQIDDADAEYLDATTYQISSTNYG
jgi:hypothetical protein